MYNVEMTVWKCLCSCGLFRKNRMEKEYKEKSLFFQLENVLLWYISCCYIQTFGAQWLKVVTSEVAPANREDITWVKATVVVKSPLPTIKGGQHLGATQRTHCGWANTVGIFMVHSLKLHAYFKVVLLWTALLLLWNIEEEIGYQWLSWFVITCVFLYVRELHIKYAKQTTNPTVFLKEMNTQAYVGIFRMYWALYRYLMKDTRRCHLGTI